LPLLRVERLLRADGTLENLVRRKAASPAASPADGATGLLPDSPAGAADQDIVAGPPFSKSATASQIVSSPASPRTSSLQVPPPMWSLQCRRGRGGWRPALMTSLLSSPQNARLPSGKSDQGYGGSFWPETE
jgi:hypothetical protein